MLWLSGPFSIAPQAATLSLLVTPASPSLTLNVNNGDHVATLQGVWSNGAPFTGTYQFVAPNFDHSGDYAISGSNLVVNNATNINANGVGASPEHVTIEAVQ